MSALAAFSHKEFALTVGLGEMAVSRKPGRVIQTLALGSCLGLAAYHPASGVAGLAHFVLPDSSLPSQRGRSLAAYYVDTGLAALFAAMMAAGASGRPAGFVLRLAGGAQMINISGAIDVGASNIKAFGQQLRIWGGSLAGASLRGVNSRNISIEAGTGRARLWAAGRGELEFQTTRPR